MARVITVGTFDTPHSGHIELFKKCRKLADLDKPHDFHRYEGDLVDRSNNKVIVGLNSDAFVYRYKGALPVYPYEQRFAILKAFKDVDEIILNDQPTLQQMLAINKPDFLVIGSDWAKKDYYKQIGVSENWLQNHNIMLIYVPYTEGISSTQLKERLKNNEAGNSS